MDRRKFLSVSLPVLLAGCLGSDDDATDTRTRTDSPTRTRTDSPTRTRTDSPTRTRTDSPTRTRTDSPTRTRTDSPTPTETDSPTPTETDSPTPTETDSPTPTESPTPALGFAQNWKYTATNTFQPTPGTDGNRIFAPNQNRRLIALNSNGNRIWRKKFNEPLGAPVAVGGNKVFTNKELDNKMYAFNTKTGNVVWSKQGEESSLFYPSKPAYYNNRIYVQGDGAVAINANNGDTVWEYEYDGTLYAGSRVIQAGGNIIGATADFSIFAVDTKQGSKQWEFKTNGDVSSSSLASGGKYMTVWNDSGNLHILNGSNGKVRKRLREPNLSPESISFVDGDLIFVSNKFKSYSISDKKFNWKKDYGFDFSPNKVARGSIDDVFFAQSFDKIGAISKSTGELIETQKISIPFNTKPIVVGDQVIASDEGRNIYSYSLVR